MTLATDSIAASSPLSVKSNPARIGERMCIANTGSEACFVDGYWLEPGAEVYGWRSTQGMNVTGREARIWPGSKAFGRGKRR
mgnify:CR=1 FL=1